MKLLKSIILKIKRLFKKKAIVRDMKNYNSEVNRLLERDEDQVILDPHENAIS